MGFFPQCLESFFVSSMSAGWLRGIVVREQFFVFLDFGVLAELLQPRLHKLLFFRIECVGRELLLFLLKFFPIGLKAFFEFEDVDFSFEGEGGFGAGVFLGERESKAHQFTAHTDAWDSI